jgi:hypothetical protein
MTACYMTRNHAANCCSTSAAACSSARISLVLDTAIILVVSIFVRLLSLRIMGS